MTCNTKEYNRANYQKRLKEEGFKEKRKEKSKEFYKKKKASNPEWYIEMRKKERERYHLKAGNPNKVEDLTKTVN